MVMDYEAFIQLTKVTHRKKCLSDGPSMNKKRLTGEIKELIHHGRIDEFCSSFAAPVTLKKQNKKEE